MSSSISVFIDQNKIQNRVTELAALISNNYKGKQLSLICILKGSFIFAADLMRQIEGVDLSVEFMKVSSYGNDTETSGKVALELDIEKDAIRGRKVLIIEDIVDTGVTLDFLMKHLKQKGPESIELTSLLFKPSRNKIKTEINYLGFEIEDKFVVGYGLDFAQRYRNLPYIGILNNE